MNLPNAKQREAYVESVTAIEKELSSITSNGEVSDLSLHMLQQKLDSVAHKYQNDESIGTARYKLYELQAFLHYFDHHDEQALDFINQAIETRGSSYQKAEKLKADLLSPAEKTPTDQNNESKMSKEEKRKKLIGLEGWLALFIVGQFLALVITIYSFFADGFLSSSDISTLNEYRAGLGDTLQTLTTFENLMILVYVGLVITMLVLLFRRHKAARGFAIAVLVFATIYGIIDFAIASSIFDSAGLSQSSEIQTVISKYGRDVARNVFAVLIWVPYFLTSKRVKATLNRG